MQPKSIFKSKTAVASALTAVAGVLGSFFPDVNQFLSDNAATIITALGALHFILRLVTKGRVVLFASD